jgi:hypothetical protein
LRSPETEGEWIRVAGLYICQGDIETGQNAPAEQVAKLKVKVSYTKIEVQANVKLKVER